VSDVEDESDDWSGGFVGFSDPDTEEVPMVKQPTKRSRATRERVEYYENSWEEKNAARLSDAVSASTSTVSKSSTRTAPTVMQSHVVHSSPMAMPVISGMDKETHLMFETAFEVAAAERRIRLRRRERARNTALSDFTTFCAAEARARRKYNEKAFAAGKQIDQPPHTFEPALGAKGTLVYVWRSKLTAAVEAGVRVSKEYPPIPAMHRVLQEIKGHECDESPRPPPPMTKLRRLLQLPEYAPALVSQQIADTVAQAAATAPPTVARNPTTLAAYLGERHGLSRRERFIAACILRDRQPKYGVTFTGPLLPPPAPALVATPTPSSPLHPTALPAPEPALSP
jgi:hypothetical protein